MSDMHDEAPDELGEQVTAALLERMEQLKTLAQSIGLYAVDIQLAQATNPVTGTGPDFLLLGQFTIGKLAFADRVQDPEADKMKDEFAKIEHDLTVEGLEDLRRRLQEGRNNDAPPES